MFSTYLLLAAASITGIAVFYAALARSAKRNARLREAAARDAANAANAALDAAGAADTSVEAAVETKLKTLHDERELASAGDISGFEGDTY